MYTGTFDINFYGKNEQTSDDDLLLSFNLPWLFEKVKLKQTWMNGELDSKILVNRPDKQVVLTTLHEDTEINSFQADDSVTFYVIVGKLQLHTRKESIIINEGQLFSLHENIYYNLIAAEDTMFLLIMVNGGKRQKFE